nr:thioredoxin family protein [uncultured Undibacterium sp.]
MNTQIYPSTDLLVIQRKIQETPWLIACLCAAWCGTCKSYQDDFAQLQTAHQDKCFAWIDIEDHADLVDDLDIENFPTILIEYQHKVLFLGTMLPDASLVHRLIQSYENDLQKIGIEQMIRTIQNSDYPLATDWSLRKAIENITK